VILEQENTGLPGLAKAEFFQGKVIHGFLYRQFAEIRFAHPNGFCRQRLLVVLERPGRAHRHFVGFNPAGQLFAGRRLLARHFMQHHAAKLAQILNQMADRMYPAKYQSDFAVQVTSQIADAQQFTINFVNNNLLGSANFLPAYKTSKARVCVTVGMMTTGYDCPDILNIGLFRPIFSPTDFIQIKGRGTRKHDFREQLFDDAIKDSVTAPNKSAFKLFDFFANCEYFETEFNYDEILKLPQPQGKGSDDPQPPPPAGGTYEHMGDDLIASLQVEQITAEGMKIDRMFFKQFEDSVRDNATIADAVESGQWDRVIDYVNREVFDKPTE